MWQEYCTFQKHGRVRRLRPRLVLLFFWLYFVGSFGCDHVAVNLISSALVSFTSTGNVEKNRKMALVCGVAAAQTTRPVEDSRPHGNETSSSGPLEVEEESQSTVKDTSGSKGAASLTAESSDDSYVNSAVVGEQKNSEKTTVEEKEKVREKKLGVSDDPDVLKLPPHDRFASSMTGSNKMKDDSDFEKYGESDNVDNGKDMTDKGNHVERKDELPKHGLQKKILTDVPRFSKSSSVNFSELSELYYRAMRSIYEEGNLTATIKWLEEGALRGHGRMNWLLGVLYANGVGVEHSEAKAILHYTFAALDSVPEAHLALGRRYADGIGVAKSCENAVSHYREVADAVAMTRDTILNPMHNFYGPFDMDASSSYDKDTEAKLTVLMFNADAGATEAIISLGYIYFMGKHGVRRDWHRARDYFHMALDKGEVAAYGALGQLYASGDPTAQPVVERDIKTALTYFSKGAKRNDPASLNGMGYLYAIGFLVDDKPTVTMGQPDFVKAAKFFKESADRGSTEGMYNLGVLLLHGRGVPQNSLAAVKQFEAAALRGSVLSLWRLARDAHLKGDCARALLLYDRVSSFGSMFDRNSGMSFFPSGNGQFSSSYAASQPPIIPRENNGFAEFLEALALAETGHAASRCHAAKVADGLQLIEEAKENLEDGVFVKANHQPFQQEKLPSHNGAVWLRWYHKTTASNSEEMPSSLSSSAPALSQMRLLSQREAFNMLRLRLYSFCSLSGSSEANLWLGDFFYYGESKLFGTSMSQAFFYYEIAARKRNPKALFNIGFMYQFCLGVTADGCAKSVGDALYRIITNTPFGKEDETKGGGGEDEDDDDDDGDGDAANTTTSTAATARMEAMMENVNILEPEEMRLYLAKRYYDHVIEIGSPGCVFVARVALMSLNFQWWWWYFLRQKYGLSETLRLSLPMARVRQTGRVARTTTSLFSPEELQEEGAVLDGQGNFFDDVPGRWYWDDYVLLCSATLLFLLLLVRHHGA